MADDLAENQTCETQFNALTSQPTPVFAASVISYKLELYAVHDQMAEWYRASASKSVDLGFDSESGQTNDFQIGIHSFPA